MISKYPSRIIWHDCGAVKGLSAYGNNQNFPQHFQVQEFH